MTENAIEAEGLTKSYGAVQALRGIDLAAPSGSVLGVLGPNGAGKTTAVRILSTLIRPDSGRATVAGVDVTADPLEVRRRIGVAGQYAAVDEYLSGRENLEMIGRLYHFGAKRAKERAATLLADFRLEDAADRPAKTYSGGMRRRLDLAGALVARPPVVFLDEPTTGLDPRSRGDMWQVIRGLVADGTTVLLTTQYLEEADQLADDIVVIDHGQIIAHGTADQLKSEVGGERLMVTVEDAARIGDTAEVLRGVGIGEVEVDEHTRTLTVPVSGGTTALVDGVTALRERRITVQDIGIRRPTLDDAFLTLTGHKAEEEQTETEETSA
ncbi:daunorubicin resistance protein DrrA family ABC transporter ATP-binding protein [Janibacter alkaliphilus]|uniref:ABC-2 type transport system ATP-binding protein n=1 Tax=Janibacter alkaliphilus TaxID=1069963 RepID=A0A852X0L2_9MICO|nr:ABC-2 type transport system ATP-binding protein [Janibacter alkaliphilus]